MMLAGATLASLARRIRHARCATWRVERYTQPMATADLYPPTQERGFLSSGRLRAQDFSAAS